MKIQKINISKENLGLTRPYTIAYKTVDSVAVSFVEIIGENGLSGYGSSNPSKPVVGESLDDTMKVLENENFDWLVGQDIRNFYKLLHEVHARYPENPGVRVALDVALYDIFTKYLGVPLVTFLGEKIKSLPTSITIGIKNVEETLEEAKEYVGRGFKNLKVKLGISIEEDIERLTKINELYGNKIIQRIDANQGYNFDQIVEFYNRTKHLKLELIEQPIDAKNIDPMRNLPSEIKNIIAADESLVSPKNAFTLAAPPSACRIFNIKLMKCGGIFPAIEIATISQYSGMDLMWGCNDESIISISAALHTAFSCKNTRYIDLDGSLDLARDLVKGGFIIEEGEMRISGKPGLGVKRI
ncbi:mandelate racemase/muconate lactonizing enzyme family protein [Flexithrix dorotheae]|uniref:mandelate racemase/muconate lactonizing enzyme family protein n=1 Tax=Flexithrix dorotheae TaxID=70993 RepID=UPI00037C62D7|nr:dipeptide epimerase [Flexithrix dorotheae]